MDLCILRRQIQRDWEPVIYELWDKATRSQPESGELVTDYAMWLDDIRN